MWLRDFYLFNFFIFLHLSDIDVIVRQRPADEHDSNGSNDDKINEWKWW